MTRTPPVGHGGHVISAGGVTVPTRPGSNDGRQLSLSLAVTDKEREAGKLLYLRIVEAIQRGPEDDNAVRLLGLLVKQFPHATLRIPELHEYLQRLHRDGRHGAVSRILSERHRGRKHEPVFEGFLVVALVDMIRQEEGGSISKAAHVAQRYLGQMSPRRCKTVDSICNDYSRYKSLYDVKRAHFIPEHLLTDREFQRGAP